MLAMLSSGFLSSSEMISASTSRSRILWASTFKPRSTSIFASISDVSYCRLGLTSSYRCRAGFSTEVILLAAAATAADGDDHFSA